MILRFELRAHCNAEAVEVVISARQPLLLSTDEFYLPPMLVFFTFALFFKGTDMLWPPNARERRGIFVDG